PELDTHGSSPPSSPQPTHAGEPPGIGPGTHVGEQPGIRPSTQTRDPSEETAHVPTPRERLRHAFSSDIPEDVLERPGVRPAEDDYAGERAGERESPGGTVGPVGQPVIRVVGIGGAGVNAVNRMVEAEVEGVEFLAVNTDLQSLQQ